MVGAASKFRRAFVAAAAIALAACTGPANEPPARLDFVEIVTGGADAGAPLPLFIGIHGLGDSPERFSTFFAERIAFPARFAFLRGPDAHGDGHSWFPISRSAPSADYSEALVRSSTRIAETSTALARERPTLGLPVIFGFSQGGMLSFAAAARSDGTFRAAVPIAGFLPEALWPEEIDSPISVRAFHGGADELIPASAARATVEKLESLGTPADVVVYEGVGHSMSRQMGEDVVATMQLLAANPVGIGKPATPAD